MIGISSVAEGQEDIVDPGHHPGEPIEHSVDILDEFRSSLRESFERAAQDIEESFGHMVEEHSNEAVILCGRMVREAEQQRMEFEQTMDMVPREVLEAAQQATEGLVGENEELEAQLLAAQEQSDLEAAVQHATEGLVGEDEVKERISEAVQQATEGLVGEDEVNERIAEARQQETAKIAELEAQLQAAQEQMKPIIDYKLERYRRELTMNLLSDAELGEDGKVWSGGNYIGDRKSVV